MAGAGLTQIYAAFFGIRQFLQTFHQEDYSLIAAPLTALTSSKISFSWSSEAEALFVPSRRSSLVPPSWSIQIVQDNSSWKSTHRTSGSEQCYRKTLKMEDFILVLSFLAGSAIQ
ncbi:hypothetical protein ILYODFUR_038773 [Ilyodon furcidens]|uniref:Uncharacterized protein n=1 Tax=Ilyodon furcidens TaxID=33524 RepID=A0ABV0VKM4_9TELE